MAELPDNETIDKQLADILPPAEEVDVPKEKTKPGYHDITIKIIRYSLVREEANYKVSNIPVSVSDSLAEQIAIEWAQKDLASKKIKFNATEEEWSGDVKYSRIL